MDKSIKPITKPKLFIKDLEKPQPAIGKATTLAVGEETMSCGCGGMLDCSWKGK